MPTNVTADYKKAEQAFRQARDPAQRLECLREMLRTIPKHKGTEHLQADIKTRIKQLSDDLSGPRKGAARGPSYTVRPEGAAQVALLGPPNAGKSTLHAALTGARAESGPYPFTTHAPLPGMLPFEDIHIQLVDLPPVTMEYLEPWLPNTLQTADAALLVVDVSDPECVEQVQALCQRMADKKVMLIENWPGLTRTPAGATPATDEQDDPFQVRLPALLVGNKSDLDPDPNQLRALEELLGVQFPAVAVSALTGRGTERIGPFLFRALGIVRVYTKAPGRQADSERPFTLFRGATVHDVARLVHKDIADQFKFARVWGSGQFDGQQVGPDHVVADRDVIELHTQ